MAEKVIAAISTPCAPGGIGVIRISGPGAIETADRLFRPVSGEPLCSRKGYTAAFGSVWDDAGPVDDVIATVFRRPKSYTGEDVVELSCHGGLLVCRRVLREVLKAGASLAGPGEFTKRAFLNGKLSLTEAEAVTDLISAANDQALRAARSAMKGSLYRKIRTITDEILGVSGHIAAYIDYPEEEIDPIESQDTADTLRKAEQELRGLLDTFDRGQILREGVDTVIVGKPNVGKSTLMNLLAGCPKSIVTDIAGTTRDIVEETVNLDGVLLRLADTAGIRQTQDVVEKAGVDLALERLDSAGLVLAVFDESVPFSQEDFSLMERLNGLPVIAVCNKADLKQKIDKEYIISKFQHVVEISARENSGLDQLRKEIIRLLELDSISPEGALLANTRQFDCAQRAWTLLREAIDTLESGYTLDAVDVAIESVISALLELTGEKVTDAVVDQVFSRFCVGK
ncbi:MAG: tRNA uridine-5-carboxymethylaminomethyl(34) synthesis GTPase MnmE [Candidatus Merdivicinus sp.]|jgi:tRNA modification GTPase